MKRRLAELVKDEAKALAAPVADLPEEKLQEAPERTGPKYLTYVRKECRLRPDQLDALTALARKLNREIKEKGERITENSLIRLAVDELLKKDFSAIRNIMEEKGGLANEL